MPAITDKTVVKEPLLKTGRMNHGTLACLNIAKTRRFYEVVLGLDVIQTSPRSLMVRKGSDYVYAVVEIPGKSKPEMGMLNHNGFEVKTPEEVEQAYQTVLAIKDEWGIQKVMQPRVMHGDTTFYFLDLDGNWWEVVCSGEHGYVADFSNEDADLSGRHDLEEWNEIWNKKKKLMHLHDPEIRAMAKKSKP